MAARKSPVISIRLNAANQQFFAQMDPAIAKVVQMGNAAQRSGVQVREMGSHAVSSVQATSASLRVLEGSWSNNLRASERFLANVIGLGPILQKAFPIVGGIAFAGLLFKLGEEAYKFFKTMEDRPRVVANAFRDMSTTIADKSDDLRLSTARLNLELAKLTGGHQNILAVQLAEAVTQANALSDTMHKVALDMIKMTEEAGTPLSKRILSFGMAEGTTDITDLAKRQQSQLDFITSSRERLIRAARDRGDKTEVDKQTKALQDEIVEYGKQQQAVYAGIQKKAEEAGGFKNLVSIPVPKFLSHTGELPLLSVQLREETDRINLARESWSNWGKIVQLAQDMATNSSAKGAVDRAKALRDEAEYAKVVPEFLRKLDAMIVASRAKGTAAALGLGKFWEISAKGYGAAAEAIERENKRLESIRPLAGPDQLPAADKARIIAREQTLALVEAQTQWKTKLRETLVELQAQTAEQDALSAAIGRGYEATTRAAVAAQVIKDTAKEGALVKSDERNALTGAVDLAIRSKQNTEALETIYALRTQIDGERALAAAQLNGAAAARDAALAHKLQQVALDAVGKYVKTLTNTYMELDKAERLNITNQALFKVDERISAINRLSAAVLQGAEAERRAALESKYAAMLASGGDTGENRELIRRTREEDILSRRLDITKAAVRPGSEVSDRLRELDAEYAVLRQIQAEGKGTLETEIALRKVRQEELETLVKYQLQIGTASSGIRAFFIEMQEEGKLAGQVIYDAFKKVTDGISDTLSKILTGQIEKTKGDKHPYERAFGELFKSVGGDVVKDSVTNSIHQGLGALGKLFPSISGITNRLSRTKADGSEASPFWVRLWGGQAPIPSPRSAGRPTIPGTDIPGIPGSGIPTLPPYAGTAAATAATLATGGTPPFLGGSPGVPRSAGRAGVGTAGTWGSILSRILLGAGVGTRTGAGGARIGDLDRTVATEPGGTLGPGPTPGGLPPTGTQTNPIYVKYAAAGAAAQTSMDQQRLADLYKGPGTLSTVFSGIGSVLEKGASVAGSIAGAKVGVRAAGGPISADSAYLVGEHGTEMLTGASGYIHDASSTRSMLMSSTGDQHYYSIDARGTDPALVGMHVQRAIEESQHTTVATSVRAVNDRSRRTVRASRG